MTALALLAPLVLAAAAVALTRRNLIHAALWLVAAWLGVGVFYLWAGVQFLGFAQILVYVGAVSMVVLFAMLLTRPPGGGAVVADPETQGRVLAGVVTAGAVLGVLGGAVAATPLPGSDGAVAAPTVREIGIALTAEHVVALLAAGVLLTVALVGAVLLAAPGEGREEPR